MNDSASYTQVTGKLDLIDRQAAIDQINERQRKLIYCFGLENDVVKIMDIAKSIVIAIPSAEPERKKGKWIDYSDEGYVECPFCHSDTNCDGNKDELHYCFSCGADMRGKEE